MDDPGYLQKGLGLLKEATAFDAQVAQGPPATHFRRCC